MTKTTLCIECRSQAELVTGEVIYPHRPDLYEMNFYLCKCGAYVGCHKGKDTPMGFACGKKTKGWRINAHTLFDGLWRRKAQKTGMKQNACRTQAYEWLAKELQLLPEECHISMFDSEMCQKVVELCKPYYGSE